MLGFYLNIPYADCWDVNLVVERDIQSIIGMKLSAIMFCKILCLLFEFFCVFRVSKNQVPASYILSQLAPLDEFSTAVYCIKF